MGGASGERRNDEQRLLFEDLGAQIRTRVTRVSEHGLTVEQALPFLRLNGRVHDEARRAAHIQSVSMVVLDGMPRLVLDLAYEQAAGSAAGAAALDEVLRAAGAPPSAAAAAAPARPAHAGVARSRRRDDTVGYEARPEAPAPPVAPRDEAGFALTVPGETPRDDRTRLFRTLPPSQMTLEEQMLRSGQWSFRLHRFWEMELAPRLETAAAHSRVWSRRTRVVLGPWLLRAGKLGAAVGRRTATLAASAWQRARERLAARRAAKLAARGEAPANAGPAAARVGEAAEAAVSGSDAGA